MLKRIHLERTLSLVWVTPLLAACLASGGSASITAPVPSPDPLPSAAPTLPIPPTRTPSPTPGPTRPPTITPPPSERDDQPGKVTPVSLGPGDFLSWNGSVEALVDEQDWVAVYVAPGHQFEVSVRVEMPCGGGDTARVALFDASVVEAPDEDGNGRINYEEALATGADMGFEMSCLLDRIATLPGDADYYLLVYPAYGGWTGYSLILSRSSFTGGPA